MRVLSSPPKKYKRKRNQERDRERERERWRSPKVRQRKDCGLIRKERGLGELKWLFELQSTRHMQVNQM